MTTTSQFTLSERNGLVYKPHPRYLAQKQKGAAYTRVFTVLLLYYFIFFQVKQCCILLFPFQENSRIYFGWKHQENPSSSFVQVKGVANGGGLRRIPYDNITKAQLLERAQQLFFPNGKNINSIQLENCEVGLGNFAGEPFTEESFESTLSDYFTRQDSASKVRFYLLTFRALNITILATSGIINGFGESSQRYVEGKEDIASYIERVELYFAANYIKEDHKFSTFLPLIGADAYGVLCNLLAPDLPKDKSFAVLKEILIAHYSPKPILVAEQLKFHCRSQLESKLIAQLSCC